MPTNIGNAPLDGLKIGQAAIPKAYVGINQIFPNTTEITAAAFDNASVTNAAQNTDYTVAGAIGSSFTLTGSSGATGPVGTQVLSSTPTTYPIAISDNSPCGNSARTPQIIIAPVGATTLAGGLSNTDTISQAAGQSVVAHTISTGISVTNTVYNTINVGGTLNWTTGAKWTVSYTINSISPALPAANIYALSLRGLNASGSWQWTVTNISNPGGITGSAGTGFSNVNFSSITSNLPTGTYSYDVEMINTNSYVSFEFFLDSQNCVNVNSAGTDASLTLANSGNIYP
tara:strand:- start:635 stop:1495 length:861 start_codon:yes stop_codon:yes gene_type:complete